MTHEHSTEEREAAVDYEIRELFSCSVDLAEQDLPNHLKDVVSRPNQDPPLQRHRRQELAKVINSASEKLDQRLAEDQGKIGSTIEDTFTQNEIKKPIIDRHIIAIPRVEGGKLLMITDSHGSTEVLRETIKQFLMDDKVQLAALGDFVAGYGPDQIRGMEVLFKLYAKYPDRVHLLKGNCEAAIFPNEGMHDELIKNMGTRGWFDLRGRIQELFLKLPTLVVTENGVAATHGSLPKPQGRRPVNDVDPAQHYFDLQEIASSGNYIGSLQFPLHAEMGENIADKIEGLVQSTQGNEPMRSMLYGDIDLTRGVGYMGDRGYVFGQQDVDASLKAIGAGVEFRGHQSKLLTAEGSTHVVGPERNIATFHSSAKGGKNPSYAIVPLDQRVETIGDEMFVEISPKIMS